MRRLFATILVALLLLAPTVSFAGKDIILEKIEGYLSDTYEKDVFTINCENEKQSLLFDWNEDADIWVKVFGETGKLLGDFQLSEGDEIILTGGGKFKVQVYSEEGAGYWSVIPYESTED